MLRWQSQCTDCAAQTNLMYKATLYPETSVWQSLSERKDTLDLESLTLVLEQLSLLWTSGTFLWITDTCCHALLTFYHETLVLYKKSLTLYHLLSVYHDPWIPDTNTCFWIFCLALSVIGERLKIYLESHCKYRTACYQENDWHFILILLYSTASCREEIKTKNKKKHL